MNSFHDVIQAFGGGAKLASDIGINPITVRQWGNRGSIPSKYWPAIVEAAKAKRLRGVNYKTLASLIEKARA